MIPMSELNGVNKMEVAHNLARMIYIWRHPNWSCVWPWERISRETRERYYNFAIDIMFTLHMGGEYDETDDPHEGHKV